MIFSKATTAMVALALGAVQAHVHIDPNEAKPGSSFNTSFTVPHGCDGSPTVEIDVAVPPEVLSIQPAQVNGWKLDVQYRDLDKPQEVNGQMINRTVSNITWSGNQLAPTEKQLFGVVIQVPQVNLTGSNSNVTLYFPVVQKCVNGTSLWTDTSGKGESTVEGAPEPAPSLVITNNPVNPSASASASASSNSGESGAGALLAPIGMSLVGSLLAAVFIL